VGDADSSKVQVAVLENNVYVKPVGYATQRTCLGVPDFLEAMFRQGCKSVTFDLKDCKGMDSTFLGVVASAAMSRAHGGGRAVVVLNAGERLVHELRVVGLLPLVALKKEPCELPEDIKLADLDLVHMPGNERDRVVRIKRLHQELVKLNSANKRRFEGFVKMLEEELSHEEGGE
jgi:hypothetical protein